MNLKLRLWLIVAVAATTFCTVVVAAPSRLQHLRPSVSNNNNQNNNNNNNNNNISTISSYIMGGHEAIPHRYPFMVALFSHDVYDYVRQCGGTIIDKRHILTAAHCLEAAATVEVVLGAHNLVDPSEPNRFSIVSTDYIIHENYDTLKRSCDIGIVILPFPLQFNEFVRPVDRAIVEPSSSGGERLTALGWGETPEAPFEFSDVLYEVRDLFIMSDMACEATLSYLDKPSVICTNTSGGKGICNGDTGGPLLNSHFEQVGVSAFYPPRCQTGLPDGFSSVPNFNPWIDRIIDTKKT